MPMNESPRCTAALSKVFCGLDGVRVRTSRLEESVNGHFQLPVKASVTELSKPWRCFIVGSDKASHIDSMHHDS